MIEKDLTNRSRTKETFRKRKRKKKKFKKVFLVSGNEGYFIYITNPDLKIDLLRPQIKNVFDC